MSADTIWSLIAAAGGFAVVAFVFYFWIGGDRDRLREEQARRYFDEHGHWPDEAPQG